MTPKALPVAAKSPNAKTPVAVSIKFALAVIVTALSNNAAAMADATVKATVDVPPVKKALKSKTSLPAPAVKSLSLRLNNALLLS